MIYLDASVALAQLFAEDRKPAEDLWRESLMASRLLQHEGWTRVHARRLEGDKVREPLDGVAYIERTPLVLARAVDPVAARILDAMHLATMAFLRDHGLTIELASYDARLVTAARALDIPTRSL